MIKKWLKNDFLKSVLVLMTGTVLAQIFGFLISPILTRIYTPEQMGELNIYLRAVGFIAALATARYELSLPLPKSEQHAYLLYRLSFRIARNIFIVCILASGIYLLTVDFSRATFWLIFFVLISSVAVVFSNLGTNWAIRTKQFKRISFFRMSNSLINNSLKWVFGVFGLGTIGLLLASFIGSTLSTLPFLKDWLKIRKQYTPFHSKPKTKVLIRAYREFPMVNLPHVLVDYGKDLLLAFFMVFYFSKEVFGWYSHSYMILQLPIALIGAAIGQVFFNKCAELVNEGKSTVGILKKTVRTLFLISILPFSVLFFFGEDLFAFVFGQNWRESGVYSEIMSIWFFMSFMTSVTSTLPTILRRQKQFFVLGIISAVIQIFCFGVLPMLIGKTDESFITILYVVSIIQSIFFIYVLIRIFAYARAGVLPESR
ncbi:MAG: lipopolysaccharide biosynthesis protein [Crocinitomicaceae bacterium]|nr:lipopolysaccharide biosynthesis protein [Crocinitomicaceae bacterium]